MKKIILTFAFTSFTLGFTLANDEPQEAQIRLHLSEEIRGSDQWAYLINLTSNEYTLVDSCRVNKSDSIVVLKTKILTADNYYIYFSNRTQIYTISVSPGEVFDAPISKSTKYQFEIQKDCANDECYNVFEDSSNFRKEYNRLLDKLSAIDNTESEAANAIRDSMKYFEEYAISHKIEQFKNAKYGTTASTCLALISKEISDSLYKELVTEARARFPYDKGIENTYNYSVEGIPYPPMSKESKQLIRRLIDMHNQLSSSKKSKKTAAVKAATVDDGVVAYKIEDTMDSDFLEDLTDEKLSIDSIKEPYILVDVWASWCVPCRKEVPYLKKLQGVYKDSIRIIPVSVDENKESWKKAILIDGTASFTHTRIRDEKRGHFYKKTGITAIPASFLLDKERRIIAVDLRGEEWIKKMEELTGK